MTKRKPVPVPPVLMGRKPTKRQSVSKTAHEMAEIVALLRQLRERMGVIEELESDNRMLGEYQHIVGGPHESTPANRFGSKDSNEAARIAHLNQWLRDW